MSVDTSVEHPQSFAETAEMQTIILGDTDAELELLAQQEAAKYADDIEKILDTTDKNNLNGQYTKELVLVDEYFDSIGLKHAPIRVLSAEDFIKFFGNSGGVFAFGRAFVKQNLEAKRIFDTDSLLAIALHEAAHSTSAASETRFVEARTAEPRKFSFLDKAVQNPVKRDYTIGFSKTHFSKEGNGHQGSFIEEAFADLTRVKGQQKLGKETKISGYDYKHGGSIVLVPGTETSPPKRNTPIIIPARFASVSTADHKFASFTDSNLAAFGLDLLDKEVPGLYEKIIESRTDPTKQRDVIKMINSVQPGLYKSLRELPYDMDGFKEALYRIGDAIRARHGENEPTETHKPNGGESSSRHRHTGEQRVIKWFKLPEQITRKLIRRYRRQFRRTYKRLLRRKPQNYSEEFFNEASED